MVKGRVRGFGDVSLRGTEGTIRGEEGWEGESEGGGKRDEREMSRVMRVESGEGGRNSGVNINF